MPLNNFAPYLIHISSYLFISYFYLQRPEEKWKTMKSTKKSASWVTCLRSQNQLVSVRCLSECLSCHTNDPIPYVDLGGGGEGKIPLP